MLISCPDCKTDVSSEALACPICGRPMRATAPAEREPRTGGSCLKALVILSVIGIGLAILFVGFLVVLGSLSKASKTGRSAKSSTTTPPEPDEPCRVEGSAQAMSSFAGWCGGGIFTLVNVSSNENTIVVIAQFSKKGYRAWEVGHQQVLRLYEPLVNQVAATGMEAAISFADPSGQIVGGCFQRRSDPTAICRGR